MLVLERESGGEGITLTVGGETIKVKVSQIKGDKCKLAFTASRNVEIWRDECLDKPKPQGVAGVGL